ncbi:N-acetylmuramidase domain-containing protein [Paracoccus sp. SSJ]
MTGRPSPAGYNGPGYATHGYHTKLAAAFKRW